MPEYTKAKPYDFVRDFKLLRNRVTTLEVGQQGTAAPTVLPSGDVSGAQDTLKVNSLIANGNLTLTLAAGQWYFNAPISMPTTGLWINGQGAATVLNQNTVGFFTDSGIFNPGIGHTRISNLAVTVASTPVIDFGLTFISDFQVDNCTFTSTGADIIANVNLHQSRFQNCTFFVDNDHSWLNAGSTSTSGLSITTFRDCRFFALVNATGNRTAPGFLVKIPGNKNVDGVNFVDCFFENSKNTGNLDNTQFLVDIACTVLNGDFDRIRFVRCDSNQAIGGFIRVFSTTGVLFDDCSVGNVFPQGGKQLTTTQGAFIRLGADATSTLPCASVEIRGYQREGGGGIVLGTSPPSDIFFGSTTKDVKISVGNVPDTAVQFQVDVNGAVNVVIDALNTGASIMNQNNTAGQKTIVIGNGAITVGGTAITVP